MILIIDNYDSFTYNLYQQLEKLGAKTLIRKNDKISINEIEKINPKKIVISPGPGKPDESGISINVIKKFYNKKPILGVCLGHECIGEVFGAKVIHAKKIYHGKTSKILHLNRGIFKKINNPFIAARYHSLLLDKVPNNFKLLAQTKDKEIMAIKHNNLPIIGIQFHTESFMTQQGDKIIKNFLNEK